ncbi:MAG: cytochrome P450 [Planctomyces sp.]|nr:cytochrome P450 [Planctomyces sp.]
MMNASGYPRLASPQGLPVTQGEIADFARDPVDCMRALRRQHGEVAALQEDTQRLHFVFGPEYTKQVLSDPQRFHSRFFAVRGSRNSAQRRVSSGLLSMNGDQHKAHRRTVMEPFQKRSIVGYHDSVIAVADEMMGDWAAGEVRDINAEMTRYMLRLTSLIVFGLDCTDLAIRIGELTERWVALNHRVGPAALVSDRRMTNEYDELLAAAEELEVAVKEMIAMRRAGKLGHDVLSLLLRAHEMGAHITDDDLVGHIALMFGAAHLTSAHTLSWTLFLLEQHPETLRELTQELAERLEGRPPTPEQIDELPVLDRVLKESMRVLPASAYSQRIAAEPVELGPFQLSPGSIVIFSQFITHHMPELYDQPEQFRPDRWKTITPSPYAYLPFGAGPRMCIGAALGTMQLKISLSVLLQRWKLSLAPQTPVNAKVMSTMLFPDGRMPMRLDRPDGTWSAAPVSGNIHRYIELPSRSSIDVKRAA